jgi:hypothetical protein
LLMTNTSQSIITEELNDWDCKSSFLPAAKAVNLIQAKPRAP